MGLLDELLGGGQLQKEYKDFVNRYEQGDPSQGYSDQEVLKRYGEVAHAVPHEHYAQAAQEALSKLSPEDLTALVKMLQDRAAARGVTLPREVAPRTKGTGPSAHRSAWEARAAPGYSRRWRRSASAGSGRVKPDCRHAEVSSGQGRARGHRGHGGQAGHGITGLAHFVCSKSIGLNKIRTPASCEPDWSPFQRGVTGTVALGNSSLLGGRRRRRSYVRDFFIELVNITCTVRNRF